LTPRKRVLINTSASIPAVPQPTLPIDVGVVSSRAREMSAPSTPKAGGPADAQSNPLNAKLMEPADNASGASEAVSPPPPAQIFGGVDLTIAGNPSVGVDLPISAHTPSLPAC